MKIPVAILTCDRMDLTRITVESFLKYNSTDDFELFYGDDASTDPPHEFMLQHGIRCVLANEEREGCSPTSEKLIRRVAELTNSPYFLYLQNDFETLRPIPVETVKKIFSTYPNVAWIRLFGLTRNNVLREPYEQTMTEVSEFSIGDDVIQTGRIKWTYHPSIDRTEFILRFTKNAKNENDPKRVARALRLTSARFMNNITNHVGYHQTTPDGKFGKKAKDDRCNSDVLKKQKRPVYKHKKDRIADCIAEYVPRHSVGAEIGVWRGRFSEVLANVVKPRMLHLIDPWEFMPQFPERWYGGQKINSQEEFDDIYDKVASRFDGMINVKIHRMLSAEAAGLFREKYFNWVYIDGDHDYEFVKRDIELYYPLIKPGGIMYGHDFHLPGVSKAVRETFVDFEMESNKHWLVKKCTK